MLTFLAQVRKSYKKEKRRKQRGRVEVRALREEEDDLDSVQKFLQDELVTATFFSNVKELLEQGEGTVRRITTSVLGSFARD